MMPLSDYFRMRYRILRLGAFCDHVLTSLQKSGINDPLDKIVLFLLFVVSSYIPTLIMTLVYTCLCKKPELPRFDPAMHVFNRPDA